MNIEFRFNGSQQVILTPENKKDEQLIQLFVGGNKCVKFITPPAALPTSLVIESYNVVDEVEKRIRTYGDNYLNNPTFMETLGGDQT